MMSKLSPFFVLVFSMIPIFINSKDHEISYICPSFPKIGSPSNLLNEYIRLLIESLDVTHTKQSIRLINYAQNAKSNEFTVFFEFKNLDTFDFSFVGLSGIFNDKKNGTYTIKKYLQTTVFIELTSVFGNVDVSQRDGFFCKYFKEKFWISLGGNNYLENAFNNAVNILNNSTAYLSDTDLNPPDQFLDSKTDIFESPNYNPNNLYGNSNKKSLGFINNSSDIGSDSNTLIEDSSGSINSNAGQSILTAVNNSKNKSKKTKGLKSKKSISSNLKSSKNVISQTSDNYKTDLNSVDQISDTSLSSNKSNSTDSNSQKLILIQMLAVKLAENPQDGNASKILNNLDFKDQLAVMAGVKDLIASPKKSIPNVSGNLQPDSTVPPIENNLPKNVVQNSSSGRPSTVTFSSGNIVSKGSGNVGTYILDHDSQESFLKTWLSKSSRRLKNKTKKIEKNKSNWKKREEIIKKKKVKYSVKTKIEKKKAPNCLKNVKLEHNKIHKITKYSNKKENKNQTYLAKQIKEKNKIRDLSAKTHSCKHLKVKISKNLKDCKSASHSKK